MTTSEDELRPRSGEGAEPDRDRGDSFWHRRMRYGPLRLMMPWVCVAAGLFFVARELVVGPATERSPFLWLGAGLIVVGVAAFFLYRWMAKRGV